MTMETECSCDVGDYKPADIYDVKNIKARVPHQCCECHGTIQPGETYENTRTLWEGHWEGFKTCMTCVHIRRDYGECAPIGDLVTHVWQCIDVNYVTGKTRDD